MAEKNASNQSIEKMFRIIETMAFTGKPMRLNEIADQSEVSSSTAMRILNAMIENGYAQQNQETYLYSLSYKFMELGNSYRENLSINQVMHPYLQEITRRTGVSCAISVRNNFHITYIDEVVSTRQMLRVHHYLGKSFQMYVTACGKVFLSDFSRAELNRYFQQEKLTALTPKTLCTRESLEQDLIQIRKQGYAVNNEEAALGMRCIAFPLRNSRKELFAVLSISGTVYQIPSDMIPALAETIQSILEKFSLECRPFLDTVDPHGA